MDEIPSADAALANAVRLLQNAEMETDLHKMERLEKLADSWLILVGLLYHNDRQD